MLDLYLENTIKSDIEFISHLIENPPEIILIHVYSAEKVNEVYIPNYEGLMQIDGFLALFKAIKAKNPSYSPIILFAGNLQSLYEGKCLSTIYCQYLKSQDNNLNIIDEANMDISSPARETRGEVIFLKKFLEGKNLKNSSRILDIGLVAHTKRIKVLLKANNINAQTISSEALIKFFNNDMWEKLTNTNSFFENMHKFHIGDSKKLIVMNLLGDQKGQLFEFMMKFITPHHRAMIVRTAERKLSSYLRRQK